ncbi:MAG: tRNA uracil 4-sulfurtransferase ThiI [Saccharofermentanales bacterium]
MKIDNESEFAAGLPECHTVILVRMGEIALKGLNRSKFEARLISNLKRRLSGFGQFSIEQSQSRIWVIPEFDCQDFDAILDDVVKVFGIVSGSIALKFDKTRANIEKVACYYVSEFLISNPGFRTFKIEARRSDKAFELSSPQICEEIGYVILENFKNLLVDVRSPDFKLMVEVRDSAYVYSGRKSGHRGLPVGTAGKGMLLLSGGIDSPVAGFMMASRGMEIEAVYFHSYPYTGDRTKEKVKDLAGILSGYTGRIRLHIVDFTSIQLELRDKCPEDMLIVIMRRMMMRIAERIARRSEALALITGESLGQVASQTAEAIACTDEVAGMPVYRPLIGTDKDDTTLIAKKIGTYETSILPYEDCCTLFVAKHPKTHPSLEHVHKCEEVLDIAELTERGLSNIETIMIKGTYGI